VESRRQRQIYVAGTPYAHRVCIRHWVSTQRILAVGNIKGGVGRTATALPEPEPEPEPERVVVTMRSDGDLLARVDAAARRQGISRTAWLHVAASKALER
jgi:hypothetical protein